MKLKVLWFEITTPSCYNRNKGVLAGWQDSLEKILSSRKDIELYIAFETSTGSETKVIDGVTYIPIKTNYSWIEKKKAGFNQNIAAKHIVPQALEAINNVKPDIIHVFGNEWPFGLVAECTDIPVVIHIQGSIVPYDNAQYPPKYNNYTLFSYSGLNPARWWKLTRIYCHNQSRLAMEKRIWKAVSNYMGRTSWDLALSNTLNKGSHYYHVEEAIRPMFLDGSYSWKGYDGGKLQLISTGISFWKGADVLLKTAHVLKENGIDFEWKVAGKIDPYFQYVIERKEGLKFAENNVRILGFTQPEKLVHLLCESSIYVHTAYIENSPNSICEAQLLGLPVISTYVGGIPSLVENNAEGKLVPANDPWQLANEIIMLSEDRTRMLEYSKNSKARATKRHDPDNILQQLMNCYYDILSRKK